MLYSSYIASNNNVYRVDSIYDAFLIPHNCRGEGILKLVRNTTEGISKFEDKKDGY